MGDYRLNDPEYVARLRTTLGHVERLLADLDTQVGRCPDDWNGREAWWKLRAELTAALSAEIEAKHGARINDRWDGARVRLCGISSSSTSGVVNALRNWRTVAKNRLENAHG